MPVVRQFRGSDDAILRLEDAFDLIRKLSIPQSSREEILEAVMRTYSGETYGNANWRKYDGGWTTPKVPTLYGLLCESHPQLIQLSLDPGFITHIPEFVPPTEPTTYQEARSQFKQKLGTRTVWRGAVLNDAEFQNSIENGVTSKFLNAAKEDTNAEQFEALILSTYCNELIERHFHGENYFSPFISVSSHRDIAIAVGRHFGRNKKDGKLRLFELRIPEIDLISYTEHGIRAPSKINPSSRSNVPQLHISVNGTAHSYSWDKHTESFVMYKIDSTEIVSTETPTTITSSWNGRQC